MQQKGKVVVIGATSSIARELANKYAEQGHPVALLGRNQNNLERLASDISIRYNVPAESITFEAQSIETVADAHKKIVDQEGEVEGVICALGYLGEQNEAQDSLEEEERVFMANFNTPCHFLSLFAKTLEQKKSGFIVGISSVAGDRGRFSNYTYGCAKGGFTHYLEGLRARLQWSGVHVLSVKPGITDTKMTFGRPGMPLIASPEKVASDIFKAQQTKRNVIYSPGYWRLIMGVVCAIPEKIFKTMKM